MVIRRRNLRRRSAGAEPGFARTHARQRRSRCRAADGVRTATNLRSPTPATSIGRAAADVWQTRTGMGAHADGDSSAEGMGVASAVRSTLPFAARSPAPTPKRSLPWGDLTTYRSRRPLLAGANDALCARWRCIPHPQQLSVATAHLAAWHLLRIAVHKAAVCCSRSDQAERTMHTSRDATGCDGRPPVDVRLNTRGAPKLWIVMLGERGAISKPCAARQAVVTLWPDPTPTRASAGENHVTF